MRAGMYVFQARLVQLILGALVCYVLVIAVANYIGIRGHDKPVRQTAAAPTVVYSTPTPTATAGPNTETDFWAKATVSPQAANTSDTHSGGTPWPLAILLILGTAGSMFLVGVRVAPRLHDRKAERAAYESWQAQQAKLKTPQPAPRPMMHTGGKTVVADPPKPDVTTNGNGSHT